ncbi:MAG: 16S rRNA (guanine527-N7)-methyltransferase [Rickettsiales bacterium]|jgi:16S rRNA (guanine527-N7)-methyltransferase
MTIDEKQLKAIEEIRKFYPISDDEIQRLELFVKILVQNNEQYNLIGKSTIPDLWERHILDSAQLLQYIPDGLTVGDFGSGAGLPAIILSILGVKEIHLIEKSFRKCEFLEKAAKISKNKIIIHQKKVEEIKDLTFDVAVSRAFSPLNKLIPIVQPFLKKDGIGIFLKGKSFENEISLAKGCSKFQHVAHPSLTSDQSRIIVINKFTN